MYEPIRCNEHCDNSCMGTTISRGRLVSEVRTGEDPYDIAHEYDQGGNGTMKIDQSNSSFTIRVECHYDVEAPQDYAANNCALYYETWRIPEDMP